MQEGQIAVLASPSCSRCGGWGWFGRSVCECVHRTAARIVLREYCRLKVVPAADRSEREADFVLDVELVSRRYAGADLALWQARFERFESVSRERWGRITNLIPRLGRAYANTRPYALYPVDEYFGLNYKSPAVSGRLAMAA